MLKKEYFFKVLLLNKKDFQIFFNSDCQGECQSRKDSCYLPPIHIVYHICKFNWSSLAWSYTEGPFSQHNLLKNGAFTPVNIVAKSVIIDLINATQVNSRWCADAADADAADIYNDADEV